MVLMRLARHQLKAFKRVELLENHPICSIIALEFRYLKVESDMPKLIRYFYMKSFSNL